MSLDSLLAGRDDYTPAALAGPLQSPFNPRGLGLDLTMTPGATLEGSWRSYGGKNYFIVMNMSNHTATNVIVKLKGVGAAPLAAVNGENRWVPIQRGVLVDSFARYETHVYEVG